jgi:hypothetical protein
MSRRLVGCLPLALLVVAASPAPGQVRPMHPPAPLPDHGQRLPTLPPASEPAQGYPLEGLGVQVRPLPPGVDPNLIVGLGRWYAVGHNAADPPLVEKYLHSGELARGEQAIEAALAASPKDDRLRFGLGVIRFVRGVERFCQFLHEYGASAENTNVPFLRLPVPRNPDPAPVTYHAFRRALDDLIRDLAAAESALAGVTDEKVKLPLRLAAIRFDLRGDGRPADKFVDVLKRLTRQDFEFLKANPEFLVGFDRGDVAWLRAYCHLLSAMADFYLAFDTEALFDLTADELFARPKRPFRGTPEERSARRREVSNVFVVKEPARLGRFRKHMLAVCALNHETWKLILAETDDDHEWLPNPKQKGVLGLPVRAEMVEAWLGMVAEVEAALEGKKLIPVGLLWATGGKGLNLKALLDDPPERFDLEAIMQKGPAAKYLEQGEAVSLEALLRVARVFGDSTSVAYAAWFN